MPEPTADPAKQPEKPQPSQVTVDANTLGESISKGLAKELAPILSRNATTTPEERQPTPPAPPPTIKEPTYDEIMDAIESGDKRRAADLMAQRDRAREQRFENNVVEPIRAQGAHAISQMAEQLGQQYLSKLPAKFREEAQKEIRDVRNRGVMITGDHWKAAVDIVYGRHAQEIEDERFETRLRQQREAPPAITPGQGGGGEEEPGEATTLAEEFGAWEAFKRKARAKGGLSEEAEVQAMNRGIKEGRLLDEKGRPKRDYSVKDYIKERREMQKLAEDNPSLGLDE